MSYDELELTRSAPDLMVLSKTYLPAATTQQANELRTRFACAIENEIPFVPGAPNDDTGQDSPPVSQPAE